MERKPYIPKKTMGWFKFLIYFGLFLVALINLANALNIFSGFVYGYDAEYIYYFFEGIQSIDILYGIALVGVAVLCVITRFGLAKRKKSGIKMLNTTFIATLIANVAYIALAYFVLSDLFSDFVSMSSDVDATISIKTTVIVNTAISIIMIIANTVYFKKRKDLFE